MSRVKIRERNLYKEYRNSELEKVSEIGENRLNYQMSIVLNRQYSIRHMSIKRNFLIFFAIFFNPFSSDGLFDAYLSIWEPSINVPHVIRLEKRNPLFLNRERRYRSRFSPAPGGTPPPPHPPSLLHLDNNAVCATWSSLYPRQHR